MSSNTLPIAARNPANGKRRSCLNALRHGLTGRTIVLPEDLAAYHRFTRRFVDDLKPKGILEEQLVQSLADTSWRLNRIPALENNLMALGFSEHENRIKTEHPEAHGALVIIEAMRDETRALTALSQHGARLSRQFEKTLKQLRPPIGALRHRSQPAIGSRLAILGASKQGTSLESTRRWLRFPEHRDPGLHQPARPPQSGGIQCLTPGFPAPC